MQSCSPLKMSKPNQPESFIINVIIISAIFNRLQLIDFNNWKLDTEILKIVFSLMFLFAPWSYII